MQINQLKVLTNSSLSYTAPINRSQNEDLDTGLGWDDMGSSAQTFATNDDQSRQKMSDPNKPPKQQPKIDEDREESPTYESKGLKNMNIPSPTPRQEDEPIDEARNASQAYAGKPDRQTPGNATPDDWQSPLPEYRSPGVGQAGQKTPRTGRSAGNKTPANGNKTPTNGPKTPTNRNKTPNAGDKSPQGQGQKAGTSSPGNGNRTPNNGTQSRNQESGLEEV